MVEQDTLNRFAIRELIDNWALWRDAGDWNRFRMVWAEESWISATWFQGTGEEFLAMTIDGWNKGVSILHFLGGTTIELAGDRAYAQTKMTISQRSEVEGVECDVVCTGRFHDLLLRENGEWKLALRQPTYEKDTVQPVEPGASVRLEPERLAKYPAGYRRLAYVQELLGYQVKQDMPGLKGPETEALYAHCRVGSREASFDGIDADLEPRDTKPSSPPHLLGNVEARRLACPSIGLAKPLASNALRNASRSAPGAARAGRKAPKRKAGLAARGAEIPAETTEDEPSLAQRRLLRAPTCELAHPRTKSC